MNILSLDLSLVRSGFVRPEGTAGVIVPPKCADRGMPRLRHIRNSVRDMLGGVDLVVIEGYSYRSKGSAVINIGELGGVVRLMLYESKVRVVEVPPASLKLYATGKGNAPKDLVLVECVKRLGYTGADNNIADAMWMRAMALDAFDLPIVAMPQTHRAALKKVRWQEPAYA
jgi:Holliday junction resolvasome RuvABC endonuclease subunit